MLLCLYERVHIIRTDTNKSDEHCCDPISTVQSDISLHTEQTTYAPLIINHTNLPTKLNILLTPLHLFFFIKSTQNHTSNTPSPPNPLSSYKTPPSSHQTVLISVVPVS